jgi:hypothetical protein
MTDQPILIYDCEIIRCIPARESSIKGLKYCRGWTDFANMGVSVIGCSLTRHESFYYNNPESAIPYDFSWFRDFLAEVKPIVVGFNSASFDDQLLAANNIEIKTDYDVLREIRIAAFGSPDWRKTPQGASYSLDLIARANGYAKTGSGDLAPVLWQTGRRQEVIDYCLMDVKITEAILILGLEGKLIDPNTGKYLQLPPVVSV